MSSMRNAVQRRNHKERAQPLEREKWGVLEKHKDYSLRAKDYNEKKARLKILRQKAAERNPDEFHYGMLNSRSRKGRKLADRGNPSLSHDAVKLFKTQDSGYLRSMIQKTHRAIQKLEQEFVLEKDGGLDLLGGSVHAVKGQHLVFVDDEEEQSQYKPTTDFQSKQGQSKHFTVRDCEEVKEIGTNGKAGTPKSRRKEALTVLDEKTIRKKHKKEQEARKSKLAILKDREKDLRDAEKELELQRAKMNNSVGGLTKSGAKWKVRERKS